LIGLRYRATRRPANWLLRAGPDRVLVKFRSFQNDHYPDENKAVIALDWREIQWARMTKERSEKPGSDGAVTEYFTYLDLLPRANAKDLESVRTALAEEQARKPLRTDVSQLRGELFQARKHKAPTHEPATYLFKIA
jgi:hypothetical protein